MIFLGTGGIKKSELTRSSTVAARESPICRYKCQKSPIRRYRHPVQVPGDSDMPFKPWLFTDKPSSSQGIIDFINFIKFNKFINYIKFINFISYIKLIKYWHRWDIIHGYLRIYYTIR
jgi:hypothetical protein